MAREVQSLMFHRLREKTHVLWDAVRGGNIESTMVFIVDLQGVHFQTNFGMSLESQESPSGVFEDTAKCPRKYFGMLPSLGTPGSERRILKP